MEWSAGVVNLGAGLSREVELSGRTLSPFASYHYNPGASKGHVLLGFSLY